MQSDVGFRSSAPRARVRERRPQCGLDWEFHIDETAFDLWSIQGYRPPLPDSEDEKRWRRENRPSPPTAQ